MSIKDCEPVTGDDLQKVAFALYALLEDDGVSISLVRIPVTEDMPEHVEDGGDDSEEESGFDGLWISLAFALIVAAAIALSQ